MGLAFILSETVPSPNKVCRFVFLFVLGVPLNVVINYVNVWTLGYHKMGWTGAFIIALLLPPAERFCHRNRTTQIRHDLL